MDMSDSRKPRDVARSEVKHTRWRNSIVWLVPLLAAMVAGFLVYDRVREFGATVTIKFRDANGLRAGITPIKYRGVAVGEVASIELSDDQRYALIKARLRRSGAPIAREGAVFWIVRPEVGLNNIAGLGTVITGPEIQVLPGTGAAQKEFVGLDVAPVALERTGLKIVLRTDRVHSLRPNSPVTYRGIEVGVVQDIQLGANANTVEVHVLVRPRFAPLVRSGSVFWNVSGASFNASLLHGVDFKVESLRALLAGGIAFATPPGDARGKPVKNGTEFSLYPESKPEWNAWAPQIAIAPDKTAEVGARDGDGR